MKRLKIFPLILCGCFLCGCHLVTTNTVFPYLTWSWSAAAKNDRAEKKAMHNMRVPVEGNFEPINIQTNKPQP
jgi:hypothetical protein